MYISRTPASSEIVHTVLLVREEDCWSRRASSDIAGPAPMAKKKEESGARLYPIPRPIAVGRPARRAAFTTLE